MSYWRLALFLEIFLSLIKVYVSFKFLGAPIHQRLELLNPYPGLSEEPTQAYAEFLGAYHQSPHHHQPKTLSSSSSTTSTCSSSLSAPISSSFKSNNDTNLIQQAVSPPFSQSNSAPTPESTPNSTFNLYSYVRSIYQQNGLPSQQQQLSQNHLNPHFSISSLIQPQPPSQIATTAKSTNHQHTSKMMISKEGYVGEDCEQGSNRVQRQQQFSPNSLQKPAFAAQYGNSKNSLD